MDERLRNQVEKEARDARILRAVIEHGPIGIVKLAERTDLPEHKVRYSLRMLENDEFIEPTPQGAIPADDVAERIERVNEGIDGLIGRLERVRDGLDEDERDQAVRPDG
ncbi:MAG: winged helix-turn-helix transcriptional regulator [Haloarculaceae archaeon]